MTFRELERLTQIGCLPEDSPSSLTEWYLLVCDTPLDLLSIGDVCRAIRQNLSVNELLPFAVILLHDDVLAGERYDGELLAALANVSAECWQGNTRLAQKAACALAEVKNLSQDPELLKDASILMRTLGV
ncbi:contact-dependent growth inhibition system immunity protein [Pseudomonas sp. R1-15]|uniref:contact-dependent growth inhibition system immunity protein n=1 Tax=Pseudomonas sp. R1-15 TaxID=2817399 RepID=UPI003DAA0CB1